jgi:hypothetical protein
MRAPWPAQYGGDTRAPRPESGQVHTQMRAPWPAQYSGDTRGRTQMTAQLPAHHIGDTRPTQMMAQLPPQHVWVDTRPYHHESGQTRTQMEGSLPVQYSVIPQNFGSVMPHANSRDSRFGSVRAQDQYINMTLYTPPMSI